MNPRFGPGPGAERPRAEQHSAPRKKRIEIQDTFLFGSLKDERLLTFSLVTGKELTGRIKRFDQFSMIVETESQSLLVYKHAILGIAEVPAVAPRPDAGP